MSNTMCPLPWMHLATHPEGKSTLCCISDHTNNMSAARSNGHVLNLNKNKVIEIVNSDYYVEVRDQMLNDEKPKACMRCYNEEDANLMSKRQLELSRFGSNYYGTTIKPDLKFIELRLGNLCNVKCRTCNPASSTQWISEYNKLQQELKFVTHYNDKIDTYWTQSDEFWDDLLENSKNVELIYINGGEPTLVEKHWYYLERLIDRGLHKQVKLWYSINMTNLPNKLLDIWKQFKSVEIHGSIDDLYERNSYIRKGTHWQDVETNIHKLLENKWIDFSVTQTVSWMNVYYLNEFNQYFNNLNIPTQTNLVYDPKFYSINILPLEYKEILSNKLIGFDYILDQVSTDINISLFNQGIEYNNWLDKNRNENFNMVFTEWADTIRSSI